MADRSPGAVDWRRPAGMLVAGAALIVVVLWLIGWPLVNVDALAWLRRIDAESAVRVLEARSATADPLSRIGSGLSDTVTCIAVVVVMVPLLRWWLGRWRESVFLVVAIVGELVFFLAVTGVVARDRPFVPLMDPAPPTSSYPSGHTAAAVALYGALSVIVARNLRPRWLAMTLAALLWCIPAVVGISRMYRGMHHLTDVVIGAVAGGVWLMIVIAVLYPPDRSPAERSPTDRSPS